MQQELEARRQDLLAKERSLDQAEAAAEKRWAKLTEDVSAKVQPLLHMQKKSPVIHSRQCCLLIMMSAYA